MRSTGVFVASDSVFKESVASLNNTLSDLKKMNAVSYKLKYDKVTQKNRSYLKSTSTAVLSGKELKDQEILAKLEKSVENQPDRFGFIAQDVQNYSTLKGKREKKIYAIPAANGKNTRHPIIALTVFWDTRVMSSSPFPDKYLRLFFLPISL
ncbi:MAG: tail fiber domain-containing protein [Dysgonamonadaceae bacterium]